MGPKKEKAAAEKASEKPEKEASARPTKPQESERKEKLDELDAQIKKIRDQQDALKQEIDKAQEGKEDYQNERQELWAKLKSIDEERKGLKQTKDTLLTTLKGQGAKKKELKQLERDAQDWNEDKIIERMKAIEYTMATQSLTLKQEKDYMAEIKKLKTKIPEASRKAQQFEAMKAENEATQTVPESTEPLGDQLDAVKKEISRLNDDHDEMYQTILDHQKTRDAKTGGAQDLIAKKKKLQDQIQEIKLKKDTVWDEWKQASKKYYDWEKKIRADKQEKERAEWEKQKAQWDAEKAQKELEMPNPYLDETTLLEQTIQFCKNLLPKEEVAKEDSGPKEFAQLVEGAKILCKKADREKDWTVAPKKKKQLKKKGDGIKSTAIKHTADTFASFEKLKISAPLNLQEVPAVLEKLEAELADYNEKVATWETARKNKIEEAKSGKKPVEADAEDGEAQESAE